MAKRHSNGNGSRSNGSGRAVLYLRMSSTKQDKSIPAQRDELVRYAKQHGYTIVGEYADEGISGDATEKRDQFLKLRDDAGSNRFDVVLCWDQDRFGRFDLVEAGYWITPFRRAGVRLETIAQGRIDWEDLVGQLVYSVQQLAKAQYLRDLSRNVARGLIASANNGRGGTGGRAPQGLMDDPDRAEIVKRIFNEYLRPGASLRSVTDTLNAEQVPACRGGRWRSSVIRSVLTNQKYVGDYVRFRYRAGRYNAIADGQIVPRSKADRFERVDDPIVVRDNHEGIVPRETFDQVQAKLTAGKRDTAKRTARRYAFSGLLRCGDCEHVMSGTPRHGQKIYRCRTYADSGRSACHSNNVREDRILSVVVGKLLNRYASEDAIEGLRTKIDEVQRRDRRQRGSRQTERSRIEKRIAEIDKQVDQGTERVLTAPDHVVERIYKRLDELKVERDRLDASLRDAETPRESDPQADAKEVEAAIEALRGLRQTIQDADEEELRDLLRGLIDRIVLEFDHVQTGKRERNMLTGGTIYVRPDKAITPLMYKKDRI